MDIMNGVTSLGEMVGNRFIPVVFFEAGIKCTTCFTDAEFGTFSTTNHIHNVISLAIEMFM